MFLAVFEFVNELLFCVILVGSMCESYSNLYKLHILIILDRRGN